MHDYGWDHLGAAEKRTILDGFEAGEAFGGPFHLEIHPTDRCNIACSFCSTRRLRQRETLPADTVDRLLDEAIGLGVRSVSISGGGEPLHGASGRRLVARMAEIGLPVAHITTNGVGLDHPTRQALIDARCGQVRISLNTADRDDYSRMMGVGPHCFDRVVGNIRRLAVEARGPRPQVIVQFLVDRQNYRSVHEMYLLGRELGVDKMLFNGLSYVEPADRMDERQIAELVGLYGEILAYDEYRHVIGIHSYEHDLSAELGAIERRIGARRALRSTLGRFAELVVRDQPPHHKLEHRRRMRARRLSRELAARHGEPCLLPWYSMIVRADGSVPPCCVLQHRSLACVGDRDLGAIWRGGDMRRLRRQLRDVSLGSDVEVRRDHPADVICQVSGRADFDCPFRATFYRHDIAFSTELAAAVERGRRRGDDGSDRVPPTVPAEPQVDRRRLRAP